MLDFPRCLCTNHTNSKLYYGFSVDISTPYLNTDTHSKSAERFFFRLLTVSPAKLKKFKLLKECYVPTCIS